VKKNQIYVAVLAAALSGCGGGGDNGGATATPSTVRVTTSLPPQTSVPAPSYASSSGQLALFQSINAMRQQLGVGLLAQDARLDAAAQAHAAYLSANHVMQHDETSGNPGFYEATPLLRARKAGVPDPEWVAEIAAGGTGVDDASTGVGCFNQWYHTVYHLQAMVGNQESIGIGYMPKGTWGLSVCVLDFGVLTAVPVNPLANGVPYGGGQQFDAGTFVTVPRNGDSNVQPGFNVSGEAPNPAPDLSAPGRPLMVYANGALGEVLSVTTFSIIDAKGAEVASRILVSPSAKAAGSAGGADSYVRNNAVFLLPLATLADGTTYTATFSGTRAGKPVSFSWSFTTSTAPAKSEQQSPAPNVK